MHLKVKVDPEICNVKTLNNETGRFFNQENWITKPKDGDVGYDLRCMWRVQLEPLGIMKVSTGVSVQLPESVMGKVLDRSSMAAQGLFSTGGVIDPSYRGEIFVILRNLTNKTVVFEPGSKIAQLVLIPIVVTSINYTDSLDPTERGSAGFGSTGK